MERMHSNRRRLPAPLTFPLPSSLTRSAPAQSARRAGSQRACMLRCTRTRTRTRTRLRASVLPGDHLAPAAILQIDPEIVRSD